MHEGPPHLKVEVCLLGPTHKEHKQIGWYVWGSACVQEAMCVNASHGCMDLVVQGIGKDWLRNPCAGKAELRQQCNTQGNEATTNGKYQAGACASILRGAV